MAVFHGLATVFDVFAFLAVSLDTRYILLKTEETVGRGDAFAGKNLRFIAGNNIYAVHGIIINKSFLLDKPSVICIPYVYRRRKLLSELQQI